MNTITVVKARVGLESNAAFDCEQKEFDVGNMHFVRVARTDVSVTWEWKATSGKVRRFEIMLAEIDNPHYVCFLAATTRDGRKHGYRAVTNTAEDMTKDELKEYVRYYLRLWS